MSLLNLEFTGILFCCPANSLTGRDLMPKASVKKVQILICTFNTAIWKMDLLNSNDNFNYMVKYSEGIF